MSEKFVHITLCPPSRLSLRTALVCRISSQRTPSVCRLICVAIGAPYSPTNKGEVWALKRTKKPVGLRLSVLTIKLNELTNYGNQSQESDITTLVIYIFQPNTVGKWKERFGLIFPSIYQHPHNLLVLGCNM